MPLSRRSCAESEETEERAFAAPLWPLTALAGAEVREQQEQVNDVRFAVAAEASARGEGGDFLQDLAASRRTYAHKKNPRK